MNKQNTASFLLAAAFGILFSLPSLSKASVTINFDVGEITTSGTLVNLGTFLFISHGNDNIFNSTGWTSGSNILRGDDILMGAFSIVNGSAASAIPGFEVLAGQGAYSTTKFTGLFFAGLGASDINFTTAQLLGGKSFASSGGSTINFGSYRTDSIEGYGQGSSGNMSWVIPADGAVLSLYAGTNTDLRGDGFYLGADITASLSATSTVSVIPEPTSTAMVTIGSIFVCLRRRKQIYATRRTL